MTILLIPTGERLKTMLDCPKLKLVWLTIEQEKNNISPKTSDAEIIQRIVDKLKVQMFLSTSEQFDLYNYVRLRVPLIRDLAEIQAVQLLRK